jgi:ATP-dependent helicase/nuclease subunit A
MIDPLILDSCDPDQSVVVEACAGSGKTWLLVSRIIRLLLAGAKPSEILAITFTRKAAQEMRGRLDQVLLQFANCPEEELIEELMARGLSAENARLALPKARSLFEDVLSDPRPLNVDTFHGWFSSLLRGSPLGSGVPQGLKLRDDFKRLQDECLEDWWTNLPSNSNTAVRSAYELLVKELKASNANDLLIGSKGFLTVKAEWWSYLENCKKHGINPMEAISDRSDWLAIQDPLIAMLDDSQALMNLMSLPSHLMNGGSNDKKYAAAIDDALKKQAHGYSIEDVASALRPAFLTTEFIPLAKLTVSETVKKSLKQLSDAQNIEQKINHTRQTWAQAIYDHYCWGADHRAHRIHQAWITIGVDMLRHYQAKKEIMRVQDFSDLEAYTAKLMLSSDVANYLQARLDAKYKHLLVDEFQDTNPLQWQILLSWLNAYGEEENRPSIFLVGDPKQSIYRFRRADVRLFGEAKTYLNKQFKAKIHSFDKTRRNSPAVIKTVNAVFALSDVPEGYPFQAQERNPEAKNIYGPGEVWRLPLIGSLEINQEKSRNALKHPFIDIAKQTKAQQSFDEALQVAKLIQKIKKEKSANWGDFLILLRSRTHLAQIERAFRATGIPCDSPRQGGLLRTLEAEDMVTLLSVLITPGDDLALAQVLRSPIYGLTDEDLLALVQAKQSQDIHSLWQLMSSPESPRHQIYLDIGAWAELSKKLPVHDLLDHIYADGQIRLRYARSAPSLQRDQVLSNLDAFLSLALNLDGGRYPSLSRFINELKKIKRGAEEESPDEGESSGEDDIDEGSETSEKRVKILTIHAAKGLESRFVFLMNTNTNKSGKDNVGVLMSWLPGSDAPDHISPTFSAKPKDPAREFLREQEEQISQIENWNLLYVALTRAKEAVHISGSANKGDPEGDAAIAKNSWYDRLARAGVDPMPDSPEQSIKLLDQSVVTVNSDIEQPSQPFQSFTDFNVSWRGEANKNIRFDEELVSVDQQRMIDLGVAFHAVMEHVMRAGISDSSEMPSEEEIIAWLNISPDLATDARRCALNVLNSPKTKNFFFNPAIQTAWEELDIADSDGRLLRIDRLIELSDELIILDYKLSIPDSGSELFSQYDSQMSTYRECVAHLRADKPIKSYLLGANGDVLQMGPTK